MPRNRAALPGRLTRSESSTTQLAPSFQYIKKLADDFVRIKGEIDNGHRPLKREIANGRRPVKREIANGRRPVRRPKP